MSATAIHISGLAAGALHSKKLPIAFRSDFSHSGVGGGGGGGGGKAVWISPPAIVWLYPGSTSSGSSSQRSEEHTSELQSLMRISYAVFCLKKQHTNEKTQQPQIQR